MPVYSSKDAETIDKAIDDFTAFPHVLDQGIRQRLKTRAIECERVRTLDSFRADIIFPVTCYNPLSKLFPMNKLCSGNRTTLRKACEHSSSMQTNFSRSTTLTCGFKLCETICICPTYLLPIPRKIEGSPRRPRRSKVKPSRWSSLFAASRGFQTDEIGQQTANHEANTPQDIMSMDPPALTGDHDELPKYLRCNRSPESLFAQDRRLLHRQNISNLRAEPRKKSATSFAVLRDIIIYFFGSIPSLAPEDERVGLSLLVRVPPPSENFSSVHHQPLVRPHSLHYALEHMSRD